MKKLLIGLLTLSSFSAFAYPCDEYLKAHIEVLAKKARNWDTGANIATLATAGFAMPITLPIMIISEKKFGDKIELVEDLIASLRQADSSEDELMAQIVSQNSSAIKNNRLVRLKAINDKRLQNVQPVMSQQEFDKKYPFNEEPAFKDEFDSLSINRLLAKLNKLSEQKINHEQLRSFLRVERETDYFCKSNEEIKLSKKRLKEIVDEILKY